MNNDAYKERIDQIGEAILQWADPQRQFRGYTEVRVGKSWEISTLDMLSFFMGLTHFMYGCALSLSRAGR
jgi:hypothetical protein